MKKKSENRKMNWVYAIQMLTNVSKHVFIISLHDM